MKDYTLLILAPLPQGGGRFLFSATKMTGKLILTYNLSLSKSVYTSVEYHALRELYTRYISTLQTQIVLKKR